MTNFHEQDTGANRMHEVWEETFLEFLKNTKKLSDANFCLDDLFELAKKSKRPVFPIIKTCSEILATNTEQDPEIHNSIITKVVKNFFPLLNDIGRDEVISEKDITKVCNNLVKTGKIDGDDDITTNPYKAAFTETAALRERNSIINY